jgi:hypothetical protein
MPVHVNAILPKEKIFRLSDASVIQILKDSDLLLPLEERVKPPEGPSTKILVSKFTRLPSLSETLVWVQCASPGLQFLQSLLKTHENLGISMANGIADILPSQSFPVKVINTSQLERVLPKGMVLGSAMPHPKGIVALVEEGLPTRVERPDVDGELWKEEVNLTHLTPQQRESVYQMLGKHRQIWDGHLGRVAATEHRIYLIPGAKPVHSQPYRAGPRAREIES